MIKANLQAEKTVLSCIIQWPEDVMHKAIGLLQEDDFLIPLHKRVYGICKTMFLNGLEIDIAGISQQLSNHYSNELVDIACTSATSEVFTYNAGLVKETAQRANACNGAISLVKDLEKEDIEVCRNHAVKICESLIYHEKQDSLEPKEAVKRFYADKSIPRTYIASGFEKLDKYIYMDKGDFIIVGGRPSAGKTAFTLQMMLQIAKRYKTVYFSLETKPEKLYDRLIACYTKTPLAEIKKGGSAEHGGIKDWNKITSRISEFSGLKFEIVKAAGWTVAEIKAKAVQLGAEVIFIDYLSLIKSTGKSAYERVSNISMDLHTLAQQSGIAVIALSQLNRGGSNGSPDMTSLRESGQIEQDADAILLLSQPEKEDPCRELDIVKNKEGQTGTIRFHFEGIYQAFYEEVSR